MRNCFASVSTVLAMAAFLALPSCSAEKKPDEPAKKAETPENGGSSKKKMTPEEKAAAKAKRKATKQFEGFCWTCHGESGTGDGLAAKDLDPKPRNWTDEAWHASVTDEKILEVIRDGGKAHDLSDKMAPNPLYAKNEAVLKELVKRVRAYRPKKK